MLGRDFFYYGLIRKYFVLFGTLFNEIKVERYGADGSVRQIIRVPVSLGPRDKTLARIFADPNAEARPEAVTLPRMSFEMTSPRYDAARHQSSAEQILINDAAADTYSRLYTPVPYDFDFELHVYAQAQEDGLKIVEQILPFFTPDFTVRAELVPGAVTLNVPVVLTSVACRDDYADGELGSRRAVVWDLSFTLKGWLFGPQHQSGIIKFVDVKNRIPPANVAINDAYANNSGAVDRVTVQPGLDANGNPTTNAAASVPYQTVQLDDNWAYAVVIDGNLDPAEGTGGSNFPIT